MPQVPTLLPTLVVLLLTFVGCSKGNISTTPLNKAHRVMVSASANPSGIPTVSPAVPDVSNPMGNFFVHFSLNLGPNITASCVKNAVKGCVGIFPSVKEAVATIIYRKTPYMLLLQETVQDLSISALNYNIGRSILAARSVTVFELEIGDVIYLNFSLLVDVINVAIGSGGLDEALEEVTVSIIMAVDEAVEDLSLIDVLASKMEKYDDINGRPGYRERFWKTQTSAGGRENDAAIEFDATKASASDEDVSEAFESELFTNVADEPLRIIGVAMFICVSIVGVAITTKGNCNNNSMFFFRRITVTSAHEDCTPYKNNSFLTEQGIEEVLKLSSGKLPVRSDEDE